MTRDQRPYAELVNKAVVKGDILRVKELQQIDITSGIPLMLELRSTGDTRVDKNPLLGIYHLNSTRLRTGTYSKPNYKKGLQKISRVGDFWVVKRWKSAVSWRSKVDGSSLLPPVR